MRTAPKEGSQSGRVLQFAKDGTSLKAAASILFGKDDNYAVSRIYNTTTKLRSKYRLNVYSRKGFLVYEEGEPKQSLNKTSKKNGDITDLVLQNRLFALGAVLKLRLKDSSAYLPTAIAEVDHLIIKVLTS